MSAKSHFHHLGIGFEGLKGEQGAESTTLTQLLQPQIPWALGPPPQGQLRDSSVPKPSTEGTGREDGSLQPSGEPRGEGRAEWNESFTQ